MIGFKLPFLPSKMTSKKFEETKGTISLVSSLSRYVVLQRRHFIVASYGIVLYIVKHKVLKGFI